MANCDFWILPVCIYSVLHGSSVDYWYSIPSTFQNDLTCRTNYRASRSDCFVQSIVYGCTDKTSQDKTSQDKTSQDKTSSDIRSQGQNVPRTKCPKDKTSQGTKRPKEKNSTFLFLIFQKQILSAFFWKWATYVRYYYFGQVRPYWIR